jgi:ribosome-binding factor A
MPVAVRLLYSYGKRVTLPINITLVVNIKAVQETKRQKQVAGLLNEELSGIFQRLGLNMIDGGMVSISSVKITPDLFDARIYLSLFQVKDVQATMKKIEDRSREIKKELVSRVKNQLRSMPQLTFYVDDTLDYVYKMEEVFKKINAESPAGDSAETSKDNNS